MSAFYDSYNYPRFWQNREYEHQSELIALKSLTQKISHLKSASLIDIGAGFGRLAPFYLPQIKSALLVEPSAKMRQETKSYLKHYTNFKTLPGRAESLPAKTGEFDLAICFRVFHHIPHPEPAIKEIARVVKPGGYFILEFANKHNFKNFLRHFFSGKTSHLEQETPQSRLSPKHQAACTIPFVNHHPKLIAKLLAKYGFSPISTVSVSNFRSPFIKSLLPLPLLLALESTLQSFMAVFSFGPSLVILAQKQPHN